MRPKKPGSAVNTTQHMLRITSQQDRLSTKNYYDKKPAVTGKAFSTHTRVESKMTTAKQPFVDSVS